MTRALNHDQILDARVDTPDTGFAAVLRDGTKTVHREAERAGFIADLIRGRASEHGYAIFLRNLVPVYAALEHALDARSRRPLLDAFADPRLRRLPALVDDLTSIVGADWATRCPLLPEAEAYAAAVADAARGDGSGLAAHAYARYLGDLSGGQILKPVLARTLGLGAEALAFYDFPAIEDLQAPKAAMRAALDTVALESVEAQAIMTEAVAAFRHNIAVSEAVKALMV